MQIKQQCDNEQITEGYVAHMVSVTWMCWQKICLFLYLQIQCKFLCWILENINSYGPNFCYPSVVKIGPALQNSVSDRRTGIFSSPDTHHIFSWRNKKNTFFFFWVEIKCHTCTWRYDPPLYRNPLFIPVAQSMPYNISVDEFKSGIGLEVIVWDWYLSAAIKGSWNISWCSKPVGICFCSLI